MLKPAPKPYKPILLRNAAYFCPPELCHRCSNSQHFSHVVNQLPYICTGLAEYPDKGKIPLPLNNLHLVNYSCPCNPSYAASLGRSLVYLSCKLIQYLLQFFIGNRTVKPHHGIVVLRTKQKS